jgi:hypothetical protein
MHTLTLIQERITLRDDDDDMTFDWPLGAREVTITSTALPHPVATSVEEAAEIFSELIDRGCY